MAYKEDTEDSDETRLWVIDIFAASAAARSCGTDICGATCTGVQLLRARQT